MAKKQKYPKANARVATSPLASARTMPLTTLKDLRKRAGQTQEELAGALGVGQDTISRLEKRSDMLLSTLRHYVECIGGQLDLVATFPDQPPMIIDYRDDKDHEPRKRGPKPVQNHTASKATGPARKLARQEARRLDQHDDDRNDDRHDSIRHTRRDAHAIEPRVADSLLPD